MLAAALAFGLNQLDSQNFFASLATLNVGPFLVVRRTA